MSKSFRVRLLRAGDLPETPRWLSPYGTFAFTLDAAGAFPTEQAAAMAYGHMIATLQLQFPGHFFPDDFRCNIEPVGPPVFQSGDQE